MKNEDIAYLVCGTILVLAFIYGIYSYNAALIEAQKSVEIKAMETEAEVKKTKERSQFWQKAVPWGEYE